MKVKLRNSRFGTVEFKALSLSFKAALIECFKDDLEALDSKALEALATILLKSTCQCQLVEAIPDESTGLSYGVCRKTHLQNCAAQRLPILEDVAFSTMLRRQRKEILVSNEGLIFLEEKSAAAKRSR